MTSLPPHADEPAIPHFLDEDEAASLTEALLHLVEADPQSQDSTDSSDELASESSIDKPPVSIHKFRKRINRSPISKPVASTDTKQNSDAASTVPESTSPEKEAEIDLVHRDLQEAMAASAVVNQDVEDENAVAVESGVGMEEEISDEAGVLFFARPTSSDLDDDKDIVYSQAELPTRISLAVKDFFGRKFSEAKSEEETDTDQHQHTSSHTLVDSDRNQEEEETDLATVAGSGFSEGGPSETIAGSGGPPVKGEDGSFSWMCAERTAGRSRLGFDSEEEDEEPASIKTLDRTEAADPPHPNVPKRPGCVQHVGSGHPRRIGSPLLVSSDLAGIQTFRTKGAKLGDLRNGSASFRRHDRPSGDGTRNEADRILALALSAFEPYKKDKVSAAMAAVAIISIGVIGWVAYAYISDWSDASANFRQSLLIGPLVLRASALGKKTSMELALNGTHGLGSVPVVANPAPDRIRTTAAFEVVELDTGGRAADGGRQRSYLVDLPRLAATTVRGRTPGSPSVVNSRRATQEPEHRKPWVANRQAGSVINRRRSSRQGPQPQHMGGTNEQTENVVAEALSRLDAGSYRVRN